MTCKEEHYTRESHAPILRLRLQLTVLARDYIRNRNAERRRRVERINVAIRAHNAITRKTDQMRKKVRAWMRDVDLVRLQVKSMLKKFRADPPSVTPQDWVTMFKGQDRKLRIILGKKELECWPTGVPSLNHIALSLYRAEQHEAWKKKAWEKKAREKNKSRERTALEN